MNALSPLTYNVERLAVEESQECHSYYSLLAEVSTNHFFSEILPNFFSCWFSCDVIET